MQSTLRNILTIKRRKWITEKNSYVGAFLDKITEHYEQFGKKTTLLDTAKNVLVVAKSQTYNAQQKKILPLTLEQTLHLQRLIDDFFEQLFVILSTIPPLLAISEKGMYMEKTFATFINEELLRTETSTSDYVKKYRELLQSLSAMILGTPQQRGILSYLSLQHDLFIDVQQERERIANAYPRSTMNEEQARKKLEASINLLEYEVMRFGTYCTKEAELLRVTIALRGPLQSTIQTLKSLGLVYSERVLSKNNVSNITTKLSTLGKGVYGTKGIGIIHDDGTIDFRFVKGLTEKHSQVVQMLFEGLSGKRLGDDLAIKQYLLSLPADAVSKIAGYELQLTTDETGTFKIVNIDYSSTILKVQHERKELRGELVRMTKQDFERLNYALLFSIDKEFLNNESFKMNMEERGNKITVRDVRIIE